VGEYGLLNMERRLGTLTALEPSIILVLDKSVYDDMILKDPYTAFVLSRICMGYLGRRVLHVSNRIWESRCVPI
jgi:CRP-like cAMP-binding protein